MQIHDCSLSRLGTSTSIKSGWVILELIWKNIEKNQKRWGFLVGYFISFIKKNWQSHNTLLSCLFQFFFKFCKYLTLFFILCKPIRLFFFSFQVKQFLQRTLMNCQKLSDKVYRKHYFVVQEFKFMKARQICFLLKLK